jgi:hypothetical protein
MWADSLQALERTHLLALGAWGGASVLIGILLLLPLLARRVQAPLAVHFALQCVLWGAIELGWALARFGHVPLRDYASALRLAGNLWVVVECAAAGIVIGATLAWGAWRFGRRLAHAGAGIGIALQSFALLALDLIFVRGIRM